MFKEKIEKLINAMKEDGFDKVFDGEKADAYSTMEDSLTAFPNYVNVVVRNESMMPIWRARYEGQELRDQIQAADAQRRGKHEDAITGVRVLNRLCEAYGMEPFANIDTTDRYAVADFVGEYVSEVYQDGTSHTMDRTVQIAEDNRDVYRKKTVEEIIADAQAKLAKNPATHSAKVHGQDNER